MKFHFFFLLLSFCFSILSYGQIDGYSDHQSDEMGVDSNLIDKEPNRMEVYPEGIIPHSELEDGFTLTYDVYFQNILNEPVSELTIIDTISEFLDFSSFQMNSSTHDYEIYPIPPDIMVWKFYNVKLTDSTIGKSESKGKIQFSLDILPGVYIGDSILNRAHIIFDSDIDIWTNEVWNAFDLPTNAENSQEMDQELILFPNPGNALVYFDLGKYDVPIATIRIYDNNIRLVKELNDVNSKEGLVSFNISDLPKGIYSVQILSNEFNQMRKLIIE